jgi:glycosyltransferase involved in cell wall biosynthesis
MSMTENKTLGLCMIAGDDAMAEGIARAFESAARQGITNLFLSFNGADEEIRKALHNLATQYFEEWTIEPQEAGEHFDFGLARQHSFDLAHGKVDWIIWLDCDDVLQGDLEEMLNELETRRAHFAIVPYKYSETVTHGKERIFRGDVKWTWKFPIHEVCVGPMSTRSIESEAIFVQHNRKNVQEKQDRNYELIQRWFSAVPHEPRAQMFMAHALVAQAEENPQIAGSMLNNAVKLYKTFIGNVGTTDDAYHCLVQMGQVLWGLDQKQDAQDTLMQAVKIRPMWSSAKLAMATIAHEAKDDEIAKAWCKDVLSVIVSNGGSINTSIVNSADEEAAFSLLAEIEESTNLGFKDEAAKAMHAESCFGRGTEKNTVVFFTSPTAEVWNPDTVYEKGSGGTEMQVLQLASHLAYHGARVIIYGTVGEYDGVKDGQIEYYDSKRFHPDAPSDVFIAVRTPEILDAPINTSKKILWLHDVNVGNKVHPRYFDYADTIVVPSAWLANRTSALYGVSGEKYQVVPNGINFKAWNDFEKSVRDPNKLVYASSPDRGLERLLRMWPHILERLPNATLDIYYGWDGMDAIIKMGGPIAERLIMFKARINDLIDRLNEEHGKKIEWKGRVSEKVLRRVVSSAGAMPYPANFNETFGIVFQQALSVRTPPVVSQMGALADLIPRWLQVQGSPDSEAFTEPFIDALVEAVSSHREGLDEYKEYHDEMVRHSERSDYTHVHEAWDNIIGINTTEEVAA